MPTTRTVIYNDYTLPFSRLSVTEDPQYAEDGITQIGTFYDFTVTGWIVATDINGMMAATAAARSALQVPRKDLKIHAANSLTGQDQDLFVFTYANSDDWGPIPGRLELSNWTAQSCRYSWSIRCFKKESWSGSVVGESNPILALTRRYSFGIDVNGLTTRTVSGTFTVSSRIDNADAYRAKCCPPVPAWFQRTSQNYEVAPDGLHCTFTVTDTEKMWTLPEGVTDGQAAFRVHLENNAVIRLSLTGWYSCPTDVWKPDLIQHILDLVDQKFPQEISEGQSGIFLDTWDLEDDVYGNRLTFTISGQMGGTLNSEVLQMLSGFGERPPNSTGSSTAAGPYGGHGDENSGVMADKPLIYDAAGVGSPGTVGDVPDDGAANQNPPDKSANVEAGAKTDGSWSPPSGEMNVSDEQKASPYIAYHDVVSYELDRRTAVFSPKDGADDAKPIIQHTGAPLFHVIQAGYAVRIARHDSDQNLPVAPDAVGDPASYTTRNLFISPASEEPISPDYSKWTIHWRYVMVRTAPTNNANLPPLEVPFNPARISPADVDTPRKLAWPGGDPDKVNPLA